MRILKSIIVMLFGLMLVACGRSPQTFFYVLQPLPYVKQHSCQYCHLRISLDTVEIPPYLSKPQLVIHNSAHQVKLEELHQWAGGLDKNIEDVVETNLANLLPGAVVASVPWDIRLKPNYHLHIELSQFDVDVAGNSILRAEYLIYADGQLSKKGRLYYHTHVPVVTPENLVTSMNDNLTHLTQDIAKAFRQIAKPTSEVRPLVNTLQRVTI